MGNGNGIRFSRREEREKEIHLHGKRGKERA